MFNYCWLEPRQGGGNLPSSSSDELRLDREGAGQEDRQLHQERGLGGQDQQAETTGNKPDIV